MTPKRPKIPAIRNELGDDWISMPDDYRLIEPSDATDEERLEVRMLLLRRIIEQRSGGDLQKQADLWTIAAKRLKDKFQIMVKDHPEIKLNIHWPDNLDEMAVSARERLAPSKEGES